MILDEIAEYTKERVRALKAHKSLCAVRDEAEGRPQGKDFRAALAAPGLSVIAELKKASPSKGVIAPDFAVSALVEAHTAGEVQQALAAGAEIIGVNNRNLKDFSVNPVNSLRLRDAIPASKLFVAESGIQCAADAKALKQAGVQAVLVGEALMRSANAAAMLKEMRDA